MARLTTLRVKSAGPGRHGDGDGLYLIVKPTGARSWMLRIQRSGKRQDIGLGGVDLSSRSPEERRATDEIPLLSRRHLNLAEARDKAAELRRFALAGRDPIVERDRERRQVPTFKEAAEACHADLKSSWSARQAASFLSSLERHAYPALASLTVDRIEASHIRDMLAPIWGEFADMSVKVRGRVSAVLNYAHSKGWRASEAPGRSVTMGLGKRAVTSNYAAMPYVEVPTFVASLEGKTETVGRLALLFTIHTAARSGETRNTLWSHMDLERKLWNRPAEIMKGRVAHTVTLTDAAIAILRRAETLRKGEGDALVFASAKGKALSDMTLSKIMRDANQPYTVHGFRSSFRDWAAEKMPEVPDAVAEAALAHAVPDKIVRAYRRTTFVEMRRGLMDAWAASIESEKNDERLKPPTI